MNEQLISFETAKLAKEKGFFNGGIFYFFKNNGELTYKDRSDKFVSYDISAPTQSLLQKWLREKHKIIVSINILADLSYYCLIIDINENKLNLSNQSKNIGFIIYEDALEDGLFEALKLI